MASTLLGFPSQPDAAGAIEAVELGEVAISAEASELRALADYLYQAARELEAGVSRVEAFSFKDAEPPRNTPSQIIVSGRNR